MRRERNIFAVCDLEVEYAYHFMEYMSRKKSLPMEVRVFTSADTLLDYLKEHSIALLLISENAMREEIQEKDIGQIVILSEELPAPKPEKYPSIYKYQSSNSVLREAMALYGAAERQEPEAANGAGIEIIGIYSPVGRNMKTSFALTLGQILAKEQAALYLNLENYSGFETLLEAGGGQDMSDLLYYARQKKGNLSMRLGGMVKSIGNLDYVPPGISPEDIQDATAEDWIVLLTELSQYASYQAVILDLGDGVGQLADVLGACDRIYMPVRSDPMSQAKIVQFEAYLRQREKGGVLEKIRKLKLPYHRTVRRGKGYLEDLVYSELGDYVRGILKKEREEGPIWKKSATELSGGS